MEMACPGAPGSAVGQQKEFAKAKEKTQATEMKQSSVHKLEAVEKSPMFCGKWEIDLCNNIASTLNSQILVSALLCK